MPKNRFTNHSQVKYNTVQNFFGDNSSWDSLDKISQNNWIDLKFYIWLFFTALVSSLPWVNCGPPFLARYVNCAPPPDFLPHVPPFLLDQRYVRNQKPAFLYHQLCTTYRFTWFSWVKIFVRHFIELESVYLITIALHHQISNKFFFFYTLFSKRLFVNRLIFKGVKWISRNTSIMRYMYSDEHGISLKLRLLGNVRVKI